MRQEMPRKTATNDACGNEKSAPQHDGRALDGNRASAGQTPSSGSASSAELICRSEPALFCWAPPQLYFFFSNFSPNALLRLGCFTARSLLPGLLALLRLGRLRRVDRVFGTLLLAAAVPLTKQRGPSFRAKGAFKQKAPFGLLLRLVRQLPLDAVHLGVALRLADDGLLRRLSLGGGHVEDLELHLGDLLLDQLLDIAQRRLGLGRDERDGEPLRPRGPCGRCGGCSPRAARARRS